MREYCVASCLGASSQWFLYVLLYAESYTAKATGVTSSCSFFLFRTYTAKATTTTAAHLSFFLSIVSAHAHRGLLLAIVSYLVVMAFIRIKMPGYLN